MLNKYIMHHIYIFSQIVTAEHKIHFDSDNYHLTNSCTIILSSETYLSQFVVLLQHVGLDIIRILSTRTTVSTNLTFKICVLLRYACFKDY